MESSLGVGVHPDHTRGATAPVGVHPDARALLPSPRRSAESATVERSSTLPAADAGPRVVGGRARRRLRACRVALLDLSITTGVAAAAIAAGVAGFGWSPAAPVVVAAVGIALVAIGLAVAGAWDRRVVVDGPGEAGRVARAFVGASVALALAGTALDAVAVRPWVFVVLPVTGLAVLAGRRLVRAALYRGRRAGRHDVPVLLVGTPSSILDIAARARRARQHGWAVVGACTPGGLADHVPGVPVLGDLDAIPRLVVEHGVVVVAVAPVPGWTRGRLHQLAWELEGEDVELVVDAGLMEVAGPRLAIAPVDGLPLLRLSPPRFTGPARTTKAVFDRGVAATLLLLLTPVLATVAVAVALDGGPVFYRQERVGRAGRTFRMIKFRSMVADADRLVPQLANEAAGPLFKMRIDPRVTRVGRLLRRYSLDELPQLFNVLAGSMSLVGPRPPLVREVAEFEPASLRRLLVRPGMTGIWQVSGRSDLPWEESVRLDLGYVENWSPWLDLHILARTARAVVGGRGAY